MGEGRIEFTTGRRAERELWACRKGTRAEQEASARSLLAELREKHPGARVWLDGRGVRFAATAGPGSGSPLNTSARAGALHGGRVPAVRGIFTTKTPRHQGERSRWTDRGSKGITWCLGGEE
jgi:hypothetical protein